MTGSDAGRPTWWQRLRGRLGRRRQARPDSLQVRYRPSKNGRPDPGEVVWAWVAFEEDPARGKDRPVLLLGRQGRRWRALMLTSKDHDRDAADEARWGRVWMDIGTGGWDRQRRPSEVRLDRLLSLEAKAIRREGAALDPAIFNRVVARASELHALRWGSSDPGSGGPPEAGPPAALR